MFTPFIYLGYLREIGFGEAVYVDPEEGLAFEALQCLALPLQSMQRIALYDIGSITEIREFPLQIIFLSS